MILYPVRQDIALRLLLTMLAGPIVGPNRENKVTTFEVHAPHSAKDFATRLKQRYFATIA
jgi:hypothetical protein